MIIMGEPCFPVEGGQKYTGSSMTLQSRIPGHQHRLLDLETAHQTGSRWILVTTVSLLDLRQWGGCESGWALSINPSQSHRRFRRGFCNMGDGWSFVVEEFRTNANTHFFGCHWVVPYSLHRYNIILYFCQGTHQPVQNASYLDKTREISDSHETKWIIVDPQPQATVRHSLQWTLKLSIYIYIAFKTYMILTFLQQPCKIDEKYYP